MACLQVTVMACLRVTFNSIYKSALRLFLCHHVQKIEVSKDIKSLSIFIRANCLTEMKKDRVYKIELQLKVSSLDILTVLCGYPAGKGPYASCKHIAALCYTLEDFSKLMQLPEFQTGTDKLQTWNQQRPWKLELIPFKDFHMRKQEIMPPKILSVQLIRVTAEFDPWPESLRIIDPNAIEQLRCDLLELHKPCAFLHILVPDVKVLHGHSYAARPSHHQVESAPLVCNTTNSHKLFSPLLMFLAF